VFPNQKHFMEDVFFMTLAKTMEKHLFLLWMDPFKCFFEKRCGCSNLGLTHSCWLYFINYNWVSCHVTINLSLGRSLFYIFKTLEIKRYFENCYEILAYF
jgi:hypothetical protein